jgi:S1-C subfamily serine protease
MRLVLDTIREPQLGLGTRADAGGVLVVDVGESSTAARAGVRAGDYLLAVNDVPATDAQFAERVARTVGAGRDAARVRVRRGADVLTLGGRMQFTTRVERRLEADPRASARAARVRGGILHGAVDR